MKSFMTIAAVALCAVALWMPAPASAQTGDYEWTISSSNSDPDVNTGPDPAAGISNLYLWNRGCAGAAGPGMSAAEFDLNVTGATVLALVTMNGTLNAGSGNWMLLAIGGCPTGPTAMIDILLSTTGVGIAAGLRPSAENGIAGTVDCQAPVPLLHYWPDQVRFVGFASAGYGGVRQDHGNGCTTDAVEDTSWGSLKALYR